MQKKKQDMHCTSTYTEEINKRVSAVEHRLTLITTIISLSKTCLHVHYKSLRNITEKQTL